jgi:hypothetical protein
MVHDDVFAIYVKKNKVFNYCLGVIKKPNGKAYLISFSHKNDFLKHGHHSLVFLDK